MDSMDNVLEIIRDVREYLLSLKETGVDELCTTAPPLNPLPQGEGKSRGKVMFPPPLTGGGEGEGEQALQEKMPSQRLKSLEALRENIGDCRRCKLWKGRTNIVFGTGSPDATLMFVGEGPGQEEDRQGKPFVGRAGDLLTKMIAAMGLTRDNVYIANVIKCRPPGNRNPEEDEIAACKPFLNEQIDIIKPKIICALGTFAAQTLLDTKTRISDLREKIHERGGYKIVATFHPAYLLRNPNEKRRAWEDLQIVMKELGLVGE